MEEPCEDFQVVGGSAGRTQERQWLKAIYLILPLSYYLELKGVGI